MNKLISAFLISVPLLLLSGCGVVAYNTSYDNVGYISGYPNDYVYSVGYTARPSCAVNSYYTPRYRTCGGNSYYYSSGYGLGNYGYWGSYY